MPRIPIHDHSNYDLGGPIRSTYGGSIGTGGGSAGVVPPGGLESVTDGTTTASGVTSLTVPTGGITSEGALQFVTPTYGGQETLNTIAVSGASRTIDLADGNVADLTLSAACELTLDGFVNGVSSSGVVIVRPSGYALTFAQSIDWLNGVTPTLSTSEDYALVFWSFDGGTTIGGTLVGSGGGASDLDDLTDVAITSATEGDMLRYSGSAWVNTPGRWEVLLTEDGSEPLTTEDGLDWLYVWVAS